MRTTTATKDQRHLSGRVWIVKGAISDVKAFQQDSTDHMKSTAQAIDFDHVTAGFIDGFDFRVTGSSCVSFKLMREDKPTPPEIVNIGLKQVHPPDASFTICQ